MPANLYLKVFDTQIMPILEYACEIWCSNNPIMVLEQVHLKFIKTVLGVKQSTPTAAVYGETGRFPMHMRFQDRMTKLWARIKKLSPDNLIHKIYDESLRLSQEGHDTWADRVNNIISRYTDDYSFQSNDVDKRVNYLRERRYTQFIRDWTQDLHVDNKWSKLDTYKLIKNDNRIEPHILYVRDKNHQRALTRLKVSSHKLNIEAGRHARPYVHRQQRLCLYCDSLELDDEIHFLLRCNFHSEARYSFIRKIAEHLPVQLETVPHTELFIDIMTSKNTDVLNAVAKFVYLEFKRRELCPGNDCIWKCHLTQYFGVLD